ncbi:MAG: HAD family phosphatase [Spirochaetales bacterium]|nr:HAD family phosphatase [Spirochaetales bacterium]
MSVKNIVFDIGNVLLGWNPSGIYQTLFNRDDFTSHPLSKIVGGEIWLNLDQGLLDFEEGIHQAITGNEEYRGDIEKFFREAPYHLFPIEKSVETAGRYQKKGYKIFLLSNFHKYGYEILGKRFPFFKDVDGGVISWEVKLNKPDIRIYETLLSNYDLKAEETVFIDDMEENIEAAEKLGIRGILFCSCVDLEQELKRKISSREG